MFAGKAGAYPSEASTFQEKPARGKHSSLSWKFINYVEKSLITLREGPNFINRFTTS
jgi:hypothetical protein